MPARLCPHSVIAASEQAVTTASLTAVGYPDRAGSDADLLAAAFGRVRYVYLWRGDVVAQAVSLLRAEQTDVWHKTAQDRPEPQREPRFDLI